MTTPNTAPAPKPRHPATRPPGQRPHPHHRPPRRHRTDTMTVHHLALRTDWEAAQPTGEYRISTLGRTLDEEGFIHLSRDLTQLHRVHTAYYQAVTQPLLILDIDPTGLDIRLENDYPHLYGPLPTNAVTAVHPYTR
ncbi:DUF952 domain-containing protein [Nonomuraea sp. B12E4]|uniref:DUF952 domain-containing protein n=1 Tax=Nonomuraea sp. B12E4 TaxID=3153564 RepID=UPI00325C7364